MVFAHSRHTDALITPASAHNIWLMLALVKVFRSAKRADEQAAHRRRLVICSSPRPALILEIHATPGEIELRITSATTAEFLIKNVPRAEFRVIQTSRLNWSGRRAQNVTRARSFLRRRSTMTHQTPHHGPGAHVDDDARSSAAFFAWARYRSSRIA